jgi:hypothetical protein
MYILRALLANLRHEDAFNAEAKAGFGQEWLALAQYEN